jgi:hypothetical protein
MKTSSSMQSNPLTNLEETIRQHWQTYRPKMWAELEQAGELEERIQTAADRTREAVARLTQQGQSEWEAWQAVREDWAILPAEEDGEPEEPDADDDSLWAVMFSDEGDDDEDDEPWWQMEGYVDEDDTDDIDDVGDTDDVGDKGKGDSDVLQ